MLNGGQERGRCCGAAQWKIRHFVGPRLFGVLDRRISFSSKAAGQLLDFWIAGWKLDIALYIVARRLDSTRILRHQSWTLVLRRLTVVSASVLTTVPLPAPSVDCASHVLYFFVLFVCSHFLFFAVASQAFRTL